MPTLKKNNNKVIGLIAALLGFLMVAGGAFGAHMLEGQIPVSDYKAFDKGMRYGLVHSVAVLVAGLYLRQGLAMARGAAWSFIIGVVLFSGSLGLIGLTGSRALVLLTPLGGLAFLTGWAFLFVGFIRDARA